MYLFFVMSLYLNLSSSFKLHCVSDFREMTDLFLWKPDAFCVVNVTTEHV